METLQIVQHSQWVEVTLARPESRNAMSFQMVDELRRVFGELRDDAQTQAIVLRGAGGNFCAGGDVKDMREILTQRSAAESDGPAVEVAEDDYAARVAQNPLAQANRQFGEMLTEIQNAPQVVIAVLEGAVMGGGFGLACVSDIAIALPSARFGLPEVTLGLTPAQIAPFVVTRIGLTRTRQLALTGARFGAQDALTYGLVNEVCDDEETLQRSLTQTLTYISKCAPSARAATKELILSVGRFEPSRLLDKASLGFAHAAKEGEGMAGMMAFITKQSPAWRQAWGAIGYGQPEGGEQADEQTSSRGGAS